MKKFYFLYTLPMIMSILLWPLWFLKLDARYIDASVISLFINILTPWYLIIVNLLKKHSDNYGIFKVHFLMVVIELLTVFINYLGWSKLTVEHFLNPDPMTVGMTVGFAKIGVYIIGMSLIILLIIKLKKVE